MSYQYWVIRFVPNVARGEFTNIGVVCGRDGGDWAVEFDLRSVRSHGNLAADLRELSGWVAWFKRTLDVRPGASNEERMMSSGRLEHLRSRQANSVQFSESSPIDVRSAGEGVELLFPHLVERVPVRRHHGLTRRRLRAEVRDVLTYELDIVAGRALFANPRAQIGKQRGAFDFLRFEAAEESVTNVWAFNIATLDVLEREIQSWNYLVSRLREDGASLTLDPRAGGSRVVTLTPDSPIDVVYDPPASERATRRTDIFDAALEAWERSDVTARTLEAFRGDMPVGKGAARRESRVPAHRR